MAEAANTNTTKNLKDVKVTQADIDAEVKKTASDLQKGKHVEVTVPKYLEKRLGKVLPLGINGAVIHIPVGEKVKIPAPYKEVLEESLNNIKL